MGPAGIRVGFAGRQAARHDDEDEYGTEEVQAWDGRGYGGGRGDEYIEREHGRRGGGGSGQGANGCGDDDGAGVQLLCCLLQKCRHAMQAAGEGSGT